MKIVIDGTVSDKFESEKGHTYLSIFDHSTGGTVKISYMNSRINLKRPDQVTGELEVIPNSGKYGQQLEYLSGDLKRKGG